MKEFIELTGKGNVRILERKTNIVSVQMERMVSRIFLRHIPSLLNNTITLFSKHTTRSRQCSLDQIKESEQNGVS